MRSLLLVLFITTFVTAAEEGILKWKYKTGYNWPASSPVIGMDGTIYFGANDYYLYALNLDGSLKWKCFAGSSQTSPCLSTTGIIYVAGAVYDEKWTGYLFAIDQTGSEKWRFRTDNYIWANPSIGTDGTVYVGSSDSCFYAINPDGSSKWKYKTDGIISSTPAIALDGTIYLSQGNNLYAFHDNGLIKWRYEFNEGSYESPIIDTDGTIYASFGYTLYAINPDSTIKWEYYLHKIGSPSIGESGILYCPSDSYLYALIIDSIPSNPDFAVKWKTDNIAGSLGWIYQPTVGADGVIYVCSHFRGLYAVSPDGTIRWEYNTSGYVDCCPVISSDGTLYIDDYDGYLYAITCSSKGLASSPWPKYNHDNFNSGCVSGGVGIEGNNRVAQNPLKVSASVVSDHIRIVCDIPEAQYAVLKIFDISGRRISEKLAVRSGEIFFPERFPAGVYLVRLESEDAAISSKVVVVR